MRLLYTIGLVGLVAGILLWPAVSRATHVRAGEITTKRISNNTLTYQITFTAYFDEVGGKQASDVADGYTFCFGDGSTEYVKRKSRVRINGGTSSVDVYVTTHTFPAANTYTIGVQVPNRNRNTKNLPPPGSSDMIIFYVSTTVYINASLGLNSTPVMLNPPLDSGRVGQKFCHNPAAFDADGDSLAFRLSVPKEGLASGICLGRPISVYQDPTRFSTTNEAGAGSPTFTINPLTGELCWDAPGQEGQYNFAFIVEEWRNGVLIGEITRDMQIIVVDQPNKRPLIQPLPDLCVQAGSLINQTVTATDPDGNRVIIAGFGGVFNLGQDGMPLAAGELIVPAYATLTRGGLAQNQPATAVFSWQTNCSQIRQAPYDVTFKVNDVPPKPTTSLVSFQTLRIRLIGPPITGLTAKAVSTPSGQATQLTWSPYTCGAAGTQLVIYRRVGCETITPGPCATGIPAGSGYQEIARLPLGATTHTDTSALGRGVNYSYRLVAAYPDRNAVGNAGSGLSSGGYSVVSEQACVSLPRLAPVITQVTVDSTGPDAQGARSGQITVRWSRPLGLRAGDLAGPYQYRLLRAEGLSGGTYSVVATLPTALVAGATDTLYVDRGSATAPLNTVATAYHYQVEFYYSGAGGALTRLDASEGASSVRLAGRPAQRQVSLSWQATVPWSNDNQTHRVYRSRSGPRGPFNQIAQVPVAGPASYSYVDTGADLYAADGNTSGVLSADSSYCYRVVTLGRYPDVSLGGLGVLENYSQLLCASPGDTARPCAPTLRLDSLNCATLDPASLCTPGAFVNHLSWQVGSGASCVSQVSQYRVYYSRYRGDPVGVVGSVNVPTVSFDHGGLSTVSGCYYVTAVSRSGQESVPSNVVCNNACPSLVLPNVFTPNGDGKNDVFEGQRCAGFVEEARVVIYNRWGVKVYSSEGSSVSWDGRSSDGVLLPSGLYYYEVVVSYSLVDRGAPPQVLKGWVQLIREGVSMR